MSYLIYGLRRGLLASLLVVCSPFTLQAQESEVPESVPPIDEPEEQEEPQAQEEPAGVTGLATDPAAELVEPVDPWLSLAPYEVGYHDQAAIETLVAKWIEGSGSKLKTVELPVTRGGRTVVAFQWGTPGDLPLEERPTLVLLGGLDGVSFLGGEAVLKAASGLIQRSSSLPENIAFVAVPWASPDGLQRAFEGTSHSGVNFARTDEDGDEALDEDGPDDLDGDGILLDMLIEDPAGEWTRSKDARFLSSARPGDAPRYVLRPEGADEDGDGLFNEDEVGGVNLDSNFPVGWETSGRGGSMGTWPLSENVARALADLVLSRKTACLLLFQGNHGSLAYPGGIAEPFWDENADRACWEWAAASLTTALDESTFVPRTLRAARGSKRPGAALDWLYAACGIPAMEVALWGPNIAIGASEKAAPNGPEALDAQFRSEPSGDVTGMDPRTSVVDRAWARWLDNRRGGVGFTEWYPVELAGGGSALLGGWSARTRINPPDDELKRVLDGVERFAESVVHGFPKLVITLSEVRREGSILHMSARVANVGELATGMATELQGVHDQVGVRLELTLPAGARILAGTERAELGTLAGGGKSRVVEWIVLAPEGSVLRLNAKSAWTLPSELEVRP